MTIVENISDLKRFEYIINVLFEHDFGFFIEKMRLKDRLPLQQRLQKERFKEKKIHPEMLRDVFTEIDGAFINLAEFLSKRPDLIPAEYVKEFEKVEDNSQIIQVDEIKKIIDSELSNEEDETEKKIDDIFKELIDEPIETNSISQTNKGILLSGEVVAVKVQKPNAKDVIKRDFELLKFLADYMNKHDYNIEGINLNFIIESFKEWIIKKLDFEEEASNIKIFNNNFSKERNIIMPKVYDEISTKKIIITRFIEGTCIDDKKEIQEKEYDINDVFKEYYDYVLKQFFVHGLLHSFNPKKTLILKNVSIFLNDFASVSAISEEMKENTGNILNAIIENDCQKIVESMLDFGILEENTETLKNEIEDKIKHLRDAKINQISIGEILEDILSIIQRHNLKIPNEFVLFATSIIKLEYLGFKYNPEFELRSQTKEFLKKRRSLANIAKTFIGTKNKIKKNAKKISESTYSGLNKMKNVNISLKHIDKDFRNLIFVMDKNSRLVLGLIIAVLIIASVIMLQYDQITIMNMSALSFIGFLLSFLLIIIVVISMLMEKKE